MTMNAPPPNPAHGPPLYQYPVQPKLPDPWYKRTWVLIGVIAAVVLVGIMIWGASSSKKSDIQLLETVDVNGMVISEACEVLRAEGWRVDKVHGDRNLSETSDCSDETRRVTGAYFRNLDEKIYDPGTVVLEFANDPKPEDPADEEVEVEAEPELEEDEVKEESDTAPKTASSVGYQAIYDEYAARLRSECPSLSITECAELANTGVLEMAEYMWTAKGEDGQYETYELWAGMLYDIYLEEAR